MHPLSITGLFTFGTAENTKSIILEGIAVAPNSYDKDGFYDIAVPFEDFQEALSKIGWKYEICDDRFSEILNPSNTLCLSDDKHIYENEDYIYISARIMLGTGIKDKLGNSIYEKHILDGAVVFWNSNTGQWCLQYPKAKVPLFLRARDFFIEGWDLNLTSPMYESE